MTKSGTAVTVAICTYNRSSLLRDTLVSFFEQDGLDTVSYEVLVVDNNSTDDTSQIVSELAARGNIRYLTEEKQGLSHARNRAVEEARGEIIAYTDDDVLFSSRWLLELLAGVERYPEADMFGGRAPAKWESQRPDWYVDRGAYSMRGVVGHFEPDIEEGITIVPPFGCNMAFRAQTLRESGGFSPDFGRLGAQLMAGDETELIERLWADGKKLAYLPTALVYHRVYDTRYQKKYHASWFEGWQRTMALSLQKTHGRPRSLWHMLWRNKHYLRKMVTAALSWVWLAITCQRSKLFSRQLKMLCCRVQLSLEISALRDGRS